MNCSMNLENLAKLVILFILYKSSKGSLEDENENPTVIIAILVRNRAHSLGYFLHYLEKLDYPTERLALWIKTDSNDDKSAFVLEHWLKHRRQKYQFVEYQHDNGFHSDDGSRSRQYHISELQEEALLFAKTTLADFLWFVDADNFFINPKTLQNLVEKDLTFISASLDTTHDLAPIDNLLINLNNAEIDLFEISGHPIYIENSPFSKVKFTEYHDSTETAAFMIPIHLPNKILNDTFYGWTLPKASSVEHARELFDHLLTENIEKETPLKKSNLVSAYHREIDNLGFDKVYILKFDPHKDHFKKFKKILEHHGIRAYYMESINQKELSAEYLDSLGVKIMPGFKDIFEEREITLGAISQFLSHFSVWKHAFENSHKKILVLEDGLKFMPGFRSHLIDSCKKADETGEKWDFMSLHRITTEGEANTDGVNQMSWPPMLPGMSSYIIKQSGIKKILEAEPLNYLLPLNEFLSVISGHHPRKPYYTYYPNSNLVALAIKHQVVVKKLNQEEKNTSPICEFCKENVTMENSELSENNDNEHL